MNLAMVMSEASKKPYIEQQTDESVFHPPLSPMISGGGVETETTNSTADCNLSLEDEGKLYRFY